MINFKYQLEQHSAHGRLRSLAHITQRARQRGVAPSADVVGSSRFSLINIIHVR